MLAFWPALEIASPLPRFPRLKVRFVHAAIYRDSGRMEVLDQYDEVFRTRKNEDLQLVRRPLPRML